MQHVVVREYARLTTASVARPTLDEAAVSEQAFEWLCRESARLRKSGAALVQLDDRRWLRLDNYVGVIETPCGTRIEILPKCMDGADEAGRSRRVLRVMLERCLNLPVRQTGPASIQKFDAPLTEWVMRQYLDALDRLVKRGLRFNYRTVQEQQRFLRGRLHMARQLRQPPGRQHIFQIEHEVFDADRPENRLLRSALDRVRSLTRDSGNWRLSHELATLLASVPKSENVEEDFRRWRSDRLMAHYQTVRPWCSLILNEQMPMSVLGDWKGMSLLFPMEMLFERYVEACLRRDLPAGVTLTPSASSEHLCHHKGKPWFLLKPDFLLQDGGDRWVLDAKWKRLDQSLDTVKDKYGLSQSDFYQLAAYGDRYLLGRGTMLLIYPKTSTFQAQLPLFRYSDELQLLVTPFDIESGRLMGEGTPLQRLAAS